MCMWGESKFFHDKIYSEDEVWSHLCMRWRQNRRFFGRDATGQQLAVLSDSVTQSLYILNTPRTQWWRGLLRNILNNIKTYITHISSRALTIANSKLVINNHQSKIIFLLILTVEPIFLFTHHFLGRVSFINHEVICRKKKRIKNLGLKRDRQQSKPECCSSWL